MRIPLSWLAEHVELPKDDAAEWLHAQLVRVGFEEEAVHGGELRGPIVVGRVLDFVDEPQKNGKTIRWCQVDVGEAHGGVRGIVCGALNFVAGDRVVVTLPGADLGGFEIAARKTYGHVSDGMIASVRELGIGDDHDGILRLDEAGIPGEVGDDALAILGLDDQAVEINVTPDRGYALSIRGIARELASATGQVFTDPAETARRADTGPAASGFDVALADDAPIRGRAGCSRFVVRVVRGIDAQRPTPGWMASRLRLAGVRSISLPVDITNYVMLELGQPIHGYDLAKLRGGIVVRRAGAGERLTTLDGADRALSTEDLLIADDRGPIGLAGVMGGAETEMDDTTRDVLIEAASFDSVSIGRTARRHKLFSEASKRYERGVDPAVADAAAARVAQLLVELAGGTVDALGTDVGSVPQRAAITIPVGFWSRILGAEYTDDEARDALVAIGADVVDQGADAWVVTPPSWRPDLVDRESLVEEIARIVGFDRIPSVLPVAPPGRGFTRAQRLRRKVADALASAGLTEVLVAPFATERQARMAGAEPVRLENPLDGERPWMRTALVPGMLDTAHRNLGRGLTDLALFELGRVFVAVEGQGTDELPDAAARPADEVLVELDRLPAQPDHAAVVLLGERVRKQPGRAAERYGIADAIEAAERVARTLGLSLEVRQAQRDWLHPGRAAELLVGEEVVGVAGELLPSIAADADLPRVVAVAELDLSAMLERARLQLDTQVIAPVPAATQDLSVVVRHDVPAGDVQRAVRDGAGALLEHIALVDDYRGAGLGEGEKSLTFALRFRAHDRTLTAAEASEAKLAGLAVAAERHGAHLRE
ncbi:phenylalanine--tRNA ligase subunit beta [Agrococcus carbonis]|uniref:Phenylalanine--tRNA ligase beta subunit n=1 Tax=Agrococcus carbonis TaxID=684552 RepID=A0A1H1SMG2_9MICO|nr:phenylalanine--tRNA ligase subunit beta [Agrococcus carbonis]SDS48906.1 phenylalanyl-tRNA synthetase beta subunit [Agrococcus carbonis]